jgi:GLPGLI family protein
LKIKTIIMKKVFFTLSGLVITTMLVAQVKEGTIVYERKINMHRRITDEQTRSFIPEFRTSKHQLLFSDSTSLYKLLPEDEAPDPFEGGGGGQRTVFRMGGGDAGELYKNFVDGKSIEATELGAKQYIIEDSIRKQRWKLTEETKTIAGHLCRKAITTQKQINLGGVRMMTMTSMDGNVKTDTTKKTDAPPTPKEVDVVAWYADDIVSPVGPENNGGLPGVILALDIDKGGTTYTAIDIKSTINKKDLKEPKKGKKVTREEYRKLQGEMMKNMQMPGGGGMIRVGG